MNLEFFAATGDRGRELPSSGKPHTSAHWAQNVKSMIFR
jgi:hypothetical protein